MAVSRFKHQRPTDNAIRNALADRDITGTGADLLTDQFSQAWDKIENRGGIDAIGADIDARIAAARKRLATGI
jgi:hypothetical protein